MLHNDQLTMIIEDILVVQPVFDFIILCLIQALYRNPNQCDQIGRFLKVIGDKLSLKRSMGYFQIITFKAKTTVVTFLGNYRKN